MLLLFSRFEFADKEQPRETFKSIFSFDMDKRSKKSPEIIPAP